jgi:hypothetical protein
VTPAAGAESTFSGTFPGSVAPSATNVRPGGWALGVIDLKGGISIHNVPYPNRTANRDLSRNGSANSTEQELSLPQIEPRIYRQRHHLHSASRGRAADHRIETLSIGQNGMIDSGHVDLLIQVLTLHPVLQFTGNIASILAGFIRGNDENLRTDQICRSFISSSDSRFRGWAVGHLVPDSDCYDLKITRSVML